MKRLLDDVAAFHRACDVPVVAKPTLAQPERMFLRVNLIEEEVNHELVPALYSGNMTDIADALADSIYVIVGTALEYGIPLDKVWEAVQKANMAKVDPVTGKVHKRADGKVLKPEGWTPPDIAAVLGD